jgi:hypothetical protein
MPHFWELTIVEGLTVKVRVTGTTLLSFALKPGTVLVVKKYSPSASNRPTVGSKFKSDAFILFRGITKIGKLSDAAIKKLAGHVPQIVQSPSG